MIPGTKFAVDRLSLRSKNSHHFLTHFHGDHYGGLSKNWKKGKLYCTPTTSRLAQHKFKLSSSKIVEIAINSSKTIDGHKVTFLPANHCPGATIILFELTDGRNILHTGDFRFCSSMLGIPQLQPFLSKNRSPGSKTLSSVYLDTTYCNLQYNFPPQREVFDFVWDIVQRFEKKGNYLYLFATYVIGKEKLLLDLSSRLATKVLLPTKAKHDVIHCIEDSDLSIPSGKSKSDFFTRNHTESNVHAASFQTLFWKNFIQFVSSYKHSDYDGIVAFKPSCFPAPFPIKASRVRGTNWIINVPYSEHSSFGELKKFVASFRIKEIIPTVYSSSFSKTPHLKEKERLEMIKKLTRKEKKETRMNFFFPSTPKKTKNNFEFENEEEEEEEEEEGDVFWNKYKRREKLVIPRSILQFTSPKNSNKSKNKKNGGSIKPISSYFSSPSNQGELITPLKSPFPTPNIFGEVNNKNNKNSNNNNNKSVDDDDDVIFVGMSIPPPPPPLLPPPNLGEVSSEKKDRKKKKPKKKKKTLKKKRVNGKKKKKKKKGAKLDPNQKQIGHFFKQKKKSDQGKEEEVEDEKKTGKKRKREKKIIGGRFQKPKKKRKK